MISIWPQAAVPAHASQQKSTPEQCAIKLLALLEQPINRHVKYNFANNFTNCYAGILVFAAILGLEVSYTV